MMYDLGASPREALVPTQGLKGQTDSGFQNLERETVWRGLLCGRHGTNGPPSPSSQLLRAGTSRSESRQSQRQGSPLTKSIWAHGETVALQRQMKHIQHTLLFLRARIKMEDNTSVQQLGNESAKCGTFCSGMLYSHLKLCF